MRHFIFEFITGGGLVGQDLPESLLIEGELMLQSLVNDLRKLDIELFVSRDSRLEKLDENIKQYTVVESVDKELPAYIKNMDVCWLIAPETEQCLQRYAEIFSNTKSIFIGSMIEAIKISSSKYLTNKTLSENNISVVETRKLDQIIPESNTGWIVKPDDGAGAEGARLIPDKEKLHSFIASQSNNNFIIQPYIKGNYLSMSLLVCNENIRLLGCNKQYVEINEEGIKLEKIGVNECLSYKDDMLSLAKEVVVAVPGLAGYIGVDLIEQDGKLFVLEINPRLTTAYVGLSESLDRNMAAKILDTFSSKKLPDINLDSAKPVIVNV
ncbi:MAG: ATP-grasp domain-containing protein [Gammaproteobacteria bacterium]|jgi:predicted ATP-grasp superfamily ATP-dependent carboligase